MQFRRLRQSRFQRCSRPSRRPGTGFEPGYQLRAAPVRAHPAQHPSAGRHHQSALRRDQRPAHQLRLVHQRVGKLRRNDHVPVRARHDLAPNHVHRPGPQHTGGESHHRPLRRGGQLRARSQVPIPAQCQPKLPAQGQSVGLVGSGQAGADARGAHRPVQRCRFHPTRDPDPAHAQPQHSDHAIDQHRRTRHLQPGRRAR